MHDSSITSLKNLATQFAKQRPNARVLDVGSAVAAEGHRSYRPIIQALGMTYVGLDVAPGPNVDVVATEPYTFPLADNGFDLVISGQAFEHIEFPWLTITEVARVMKPGGVAIIIAPSSGPEHRYPQDCWRFYKDGMVAFAKWAKLECLHSSTNWLETRQFMWGDTIGIFWKRTDASPPAFDISNLHPAPSPRRVRVALRQLVARTPLIWRLSRLI
jgi:SAM-dependent methyltransferase